MVQRKKILNIQENIRIFLVQSPSGGNFKWYVPSTLEQDPNLAKTQHTSITNIVKRLYRYLLQLCGLVLSSVYMLHLFETSAQFQILPG